MDAFADLQRQVIAAGLMERRPLFFFVRMTVTFLLLLVGIAMLFMSTSLWLHLIIAAYFAFLYGQIGLLGHDAGHRQIFARAWKDMVVGYVCCLFLGVSHKWWVEKHNEHHAHPNTEDMDPDIDFPMLAFSKKQACAKKGFMRFIARHQAFLFFPMLCFVSVSLRAGGISFLLRKHLSHTWLEILVIAAHFLIYFALVFLFFTLLHGVLFILVHQALFGLYMGSIFAPNHKGMPVLPKEVKIDFLREQILTARNVRSNAFIDFWYGGLNYQIEHHLFPVMPRHNLRRARGIVKRFCLANGIPYHETGIVRSYVEILSHMRAIGRLVTLPT